MRAWLSVLLMALAVPAGAELRAPAIKGRRSVPIYVGVPTLAQVVCGGVTNGSVCGGSGGSGSTVDLAAPSTGTDLGAAATPYKRLYLYGAGTFGTTSMLFTGTPTAARTYTFPDANTSIPIFGQTVTFAGPTAARTYTLPDAAVTLASLTGSEVFTNKTLTAPTINGTVATTGLLLPTHDIVNADTTLTRSAAGILSVEGVDLVTLSATQALTNKTLTAPALNGTVTTSGLLLPTFDLMNADTTLARSAAGVVSAEGVDLVSVSGAQSLTNKTIVSFDLGSAATDTTITRSAAGVVAVEGVDLASLSGAQSLTNKTIPSFELGTAATDTTITRSAAGKVAVEGVDLVDLSSSQAISNKKITSNAQGFVLLNDANLRLGTIDDTSGGALNYSTWTPKQFRIGAGSTSTSISFGLSGDIATNFGNGVCGSTGACAQPTWNFMKGSAAAPEQNHWSQAYYGGSGGLVKALSAGSATAILRIPIASDRGRGGWIRYRIFASDGTAQQVRAGHVQFAMVAEGTTETCAVYGVDALLTVNPDQTQDGSGAGAITSGTLTYQWGVSTSPSNACDLTLNAASSLTETTLEFSGVIETFGYNGTGTGEPVPQ